MTDYRAELQALVTAYDEHGGRWPQHHEDALFNAVKRARAALAEPVAEPPAPPAEGEIDQLVSKLRDYAQGEQENGWHDDAARFRRAAELLERQRTRKQILSIATELENTNEH